MPADQLALPLRYNIAPTQAVAVVRLDPECSARELALLRWGLIPSWSDDPSIGNQMINAGAESVATKPAFRAARETLDREEPGCGPGQVPYWG